MDVVKLMFSTYVAPLTSNEEGCTLSEFMHYYDCGCSSPHRRLLYVEKNITVAKMDREELHPSLSLFLLNEVST